MHDVHVEFWALVTVKSDLLSAFRRTRNNVSTCDTSWARYVACQFKWLDAPSLIRVGKNKRRCFTSGTCTVGQVATLIHQTNSNVVHTGDKSETSASVLTNIRYCRLKSSTVQYSRLLTWQKGVRNARRLSTLLKSWDALTRYVREVFYFNGRSPRCLSLMCLLYIANFHVFTAVNIVVNCWHFLS